MSIKISISVKSLKPFLAVIDGLIAEKQNEIDELKGVRNDLLNGSNANLSMLSNGNINNSSNDAIQSIDGYMPNWTWLKKITFVLEKFGAMNTTSIVAKIFEYEPSLMPERTKVVASVSAMLSSKSKDGGVFEKTTNDRNEFVYGLRSIDAVVDKV